MAWVNWDKDSLEETLSYVHSKGTVEHPASKKNNDASAEGSNHGDRVVADALAFLVAKKRAVPRETVVAEPEPSVLSILGRRQFREKQNRFSMSKWA